MPKRGVTQTALHALKNTQFSKYPATPVPLKLQCPRRYCIHHFDGAPCLIACTPLKQKPAKSAERGPITSPHSAIIPRVSLVEHPRISLNQNTRNVTVRRKPCEKDFTSTWVTHEKFGGRSSMINQPLQLKRTQSETWQTSCEEISAQSYVFSLVSSLESLQSVNSQECTKNVENKKETFRPDNKRLLDTIYAWCGVTWNSIFQVAALTLFYFARHVQNNLRSAPPALWFFDVLFFSRLRASPFSFTLL